MEKGLLIDENTLNERINQIADQINNDFKGETITLICILKGSLYFYADLSRKINLDTELEFIRVSSYDGEDSTGEIEFKLDLDYEQLPDNYYPCTYEGELVNNASYQNGQYGYFYIAAESGWKASLIDRNSTEPVTTKLCTTINGKPIVNMNGMFASSKAVSIDTSSFDTSKVTDMGAMFVGVKAEELDFSSFDTSNVTNMGAMFATAEVKELDLSSFNTSRVTDISGMFNSASNIKSLDLSSFDTSNVTSFGGLFSGNTSITDLNMSNWDYSNMTNSFKTDISFNNLPNLKLNTL